jgi:hypothetical protein
MQTSNKKQIKEEFKKVALTFFLYGPAVFFVAWFILLGYASYLESLYE